MSEHTIAVVIPTCDRPLDFLQLSIESVLRQSKPPSEIIVVDNGSEYLEPSSLPRRVRLVRLPSRVGPSSARNYGASVARSEFIAFLDDDDSWDKDYLSEISKYVNDLSADVVLGRLVQLDKCGRYHPYKLFPQNVLHQRRVFYSNPGFGGQNLTIRRELFLTHGGFDIQMPASEDRDLAARLIISGIRLVSAPNAFAIIRHHTGPRARNNQIIGNWIFIRKHWFEMTTLELLKALYLLHRRCLSEFSIALRRHLLMNCLVLSNISFINTLLSGRPC